jgi:hypothetical protein
VNAKEHLLLYRVQAEKENLEDPEGRLRKGQRIRWAHSAPGYGDMEVLYLCAPSGLYRRPLRDDDTSDLAVFVRESNAMLGQFGTPTTRLPCPKEHPEASYERANLMVFFRYLYDDSCTTGHAIHMEVVAETVED